MDEWTLSAVRTQEWLGRAQGCHPVSMGLPSFGLSTVGTVSLALLLACGGGESQDEPQPDCVGEEAPALRAGRSSQGEFVAFSNGAEIALQYAAQAGPALPLNVETRGLARGEAHPLQLRLNLAVDGQDIAELSASAFRVACTEGDDAVVSSVALAMHTRPPIPVDGLEATLSGDIEDVDGRSAEFSLAVLLVP